MYIVLYSEEKGNCHSNRYHAAARSHAAVELTDWPLPPAPSPILLHGRLHLVHLGLLATSHQPFPRGLAPDEAAGE